jgi:hypothetical protein
MRGGLSLLVFILGAFTLCFIGKYEVTFFMGIPINKAVFLGMAVGKKSRCST